MVYWASIANTNPNVAQGVTEWNQISAVYTLLNLYANNEQVSWPICVGPWVDVASLNANTLNGWAGSENVWFSYQGNGVV